MTSFGATRNVTAVAFEFPFASVTVTCAGYEPTVVGVPVIEPPPPTESPAGRPEADQVYGPWPPVADREPT